MGANRWLKPPAGTCEAWVTVAAHDDGGLQPVVQASVPHHALIFHRDGDSYVCSLEVSVTAHRGEQQAGGGVASSEVRTQDAAARRADTPLTVAVPLRIRGDEPVVLDVTARVSGTRRTWRRTLQLEPRTLAAAPVVLEKVALDLSRGEALPEDLVMLPLSVHLVRSTLAADWPADGVTVRFRAQGPDGRILPAHDEPVMLAPGLGDTLVVPVAWPVAELPFGAVSVATDLVWLQGTDELRLPRDPVLQIVNLQVPVQQDAVWQRHIRWLDGLVNADVCDSLLTLPAVARSAAWRDLWPDTRARREHLLHIVAADRRFSGHRRGAETDRGRILVRWGEPDTVEQRADSRSPGATWEIWTYEASGRRFYFHDAHGLADFRLRRTEDSGLR